MNKVFLAVMICIFVSTTVLSGHHENNEVVLPAKISKNDIAGDIYNHPDVVKSTNNGNTTLDVTTLMSSDGKFGTGMYRSGKIRLEIKEPWGVNEFFYVLEGNITLTSSDGTVTKINAGEAVSIPKEWTGIWDTDGYNKIWVIHSEDGSALE